jgi:hypothetical protein
MARLQMNEWTNEAMWFKLTYHSCFFNEIPIKNVNVNETIMKRPLWRKEPNGREREGRKIILFRRHFDVFIYRKNLSVVIYHGGAIRKSQKNLFPLVSHMRGGWRSRLTNGDWGTQKLLRFASSRTNSCWNTKNLNFVCPAAFDASKWDSNIAKRLYFK